MSSSEFSAEERLKSLSKEKAQLLKLLLHEKIRETNKIKRFPRENRAGAVQVLTSWAQQRLWFIDQLEGRSEAYHIAVALRLHGTLNEPALHNALDALVKRHEVLRTTFVNVDGDPKQEIAADGEFSLKTVDLSTYEAAERETQVQLHKLEEARNEFDLRTGPLIRGRLLCVARDEHILLITMHHIISDGWSMGVLMRELEELYDAYRVGNDGALEPLPIQYADYALWQRGWLKGAVRENQLRYWRERLDGIPDQLELPTDRPRPAVQSFRGENVEVALDPQLTADLRALAQQHDLTLFMALHAGWAILLSRLSGFEDIVIGTPIANRQQAELEGLIGFFVNTLALRLPTQRDFTLGQLLKHVKEVALSAYQHQDIPFEQVVEAVQPQRSLSRNPIFQVMFALQTAPRGEPRFSGLTATWETEAYEFSMFDLMLSLEERGDRIVGTLNYATDLFDRGTVERWIACFKLLLTSMTQGVQARIGDLPILPDFERQQVIEIFNATRADYPQDQLIHQLFEEQARRTPDTVAVEQREGGLTYAQLDQKATQLAGYLRSKGVGPDCVVGVCVERSLDAVTSLLGVLKAGGAYLPLDPNYPAERLRQMIEDAAPRAIITQRELTTIVPVTSVELVELDTKREEIARFVEKQLPAEAPRLTSDNLVYVIYTSGSTGRPKGTAMAHRSMVNLLEWHRRTLSAGEGKRVLQFAALSFDVAFQEIFSTLCTGGTLVLPEEWVRRDARALTDFLNTYSIERLFVPPLMLQSLAEYSKATGAVPGHLQDVITAGEQLRVSPEIRDFFRRLEGCRLHNHYGPTESHVVTALTLTGDPGAWPVLPSIGRPIANTYIYVLDARLQPVPVGVAGEIYIGGANVARGYLNRSELTAQRFVSDPFSVDLQARMYKTGDLGRWRADGTLEYLGRNDDQVKIRGFRIELGEIEAQLAQHAQVKEVAVVVREDVPGDKRLVAYLTPRAESSNLNAEELRAHLKASLPDHMVPSAFVVLESLPLTPSGKLDRRALPAPDLDAYVTRAYEAPQGEIEEVLAGIWQELLKVKRVGRHDNFFELGGHSLLIVQMMERLRRVGVSANVRSIYKSPTLADLARTLAGEKEREIEIPPNLIPLQCEAITPQMLTLVELDAEHIERIVRSVPGGAANVQDIYPLAPLQEGMLFHHLLNEQGGDTYVLPILLSLSSRQKLEAFIAALQQVIDRHDILRTAILWEQLPRPVQVVYRGASLPVEEIELDRDRDPIEQLKERMRPEHQRLELRQAPLMRLKIAADTRSEQWYALLQLHHLACDHESLGVTFSELTAHMLRQAHGLPAPMPYRNHVAQALAHSKANDAEAFFRGKLADVDEPTAAFGLLDVHRNGRVGEVGRLLEPTLGKRIRSQVRRLGVTAATFFHAAWALVLARTSGRDDVVFGSVLLGRLHGDAGAQRILGMFMNTLPLRLCLRDVTAKELLELANS